MSQYNAPPDLLATIRDLKTRMQALANTQATPVYTTVARPTSDKVTPGKIIFVSDASAGSKFQGWDGSSWVSLG